MNGKWKTASLAASAIGILTSCSAATPTNIWSANASAKLSAETPYPCRIARPLSRSEFEYRERVFETLESEIKHLRTHYTNDEIPIAYLARAREEIARAYGVGEMDRRLTREWCVAQGFE